MPEVKLIFLMREPISRAWSHAKHSFRFREINFAPSTEPFEAIANRQWRECCAHDWSLVSGDYLGQLRRWLSVFPREQLFLGFYESIVSRPRDVLRDVFAFLGVSSDVESSALPFAEKILPGLPGALAPSLRRFLQNQLHDRTRELASFLRERFNLPLPPEWSAILSPEGHEHQLVATFVPPDSAWSESQGPAPPHSSVNDDPVPCEGTEVDTGHGAAAVFRRDLDDRFLASVLAHEETFPMEPRLVLEGYHGYNVVFYRHRLYALAQSLGTVDLAEIGAADLQRHQDCNSCFIAPTLDEVKEQVDMHVVALRGLKPHGLESQQGDLLGERNEQG
jgi:hypothetical protein